MRADLEVLTTGDNFTFVPATGLDTFAPLGEFLTLEPEPKGLEGWRTPADPRIETPPDLPGLDGAFWPEDAFLARRILVVRGVHGAGWNGETSSLAATSFRDRVAALTGEAVKLMVADEAGRREVTGYVSTAPIVDRLSRQDTRVAIFITCPDPLKYGNAIHYPAGTGALTLENSGTGKVAFTISATERITSLDIQFGSGRVAWAGDSDGLVLDLADGRPLTPAGNETGYLIAADAIRIPQGQHEISVTADAPVTLTLRPGWK